MMQEILTYFSGLDLYGWLEIVAMAAGIWYVYLEIRKTKLLWYVCIVTSLLNIFVYWHNSYLSMALIQLYYIGTSLYGIRAFRKIREEAAAGSGGSDALADEKVAIRRFDWKTGGIAAAVSVALFFILTPVLRAYAAAHGPLLFPSQPCWDAFIAVGSMLGTFFLSKSYMCQWYVWLVVNMVTVCVFLYSGMYWMAGMYAVYIVMSVLGIRNWRRNGVYVG